MSLLEHELKRVPPGMCDSTNLAVHMEDRAAQIIGLAQNEQGVLSRAFSTKIAFPTGINTGTPAGNVEGIFPYSSTSAAADKLLVIKGGTLYWTTVSANQPQAVANSLHVTIPNLTVVTNSSGINFTAGKRVRAIQHKNQVYFVQDGGMLPVRYDGTTLYKLGIVAPIAPTFTSAGAAGPPNTLNGAVEYFVTYANAADEESSPSPILSHTYANVQSGSIGVTASTDAQVTRIYLYRTTAGGTTLFYRTNQTGFANTTGNVTDSTSDATIVGNTAGPGFGENDPPLSAYLIGLWQNRVVLNSTADREVIQISNLDQPGQYPVLGDPTIPTDGATLRCKNELGDDITGFKSYGTFLFLFHRQTIGIVQGTGPSDFVFKHSDRGGCIAPDSITECIQGITFLGEDGVYIIHFDIRTAFQPVKISSDLDQNFKAVAVAFDAPGVYPPTQVITRENRAAASMGWFMQNRYYLACPPYIYIYDFETGGWVLDYMTGMPYGVNDGGQSGNSFGYLSGCVVNVQRQYQVALYNPGYTPTSGVNGGFIYVGSYYPLTPDGSDTWGVLYATRAIDGNGVPRSSKKRMRFITPFGTVLAISNTSGVVVLAAAFSGTVTLLCDGAVRESYPFDILFPYAADYARAQAEGKLLKQECSPQATGRVNSIVIAGTVAGDLQITDILGEYVRLDGS